MMKEIQRAAGHVIFQVNDSKGNLVAYRVFPTQNLGDSTKGHEFGTLHEARATVPVFKKVENLNGFEIFKVTDLNNYVGCARYVTRLDEADVGPLVRTLTEARTMAGGIKKRA